MENAIQLWMDNKTELLLGDTLTANEFITEMLEQRNNVYRIYNGRLLGDLSFFQETEMAINSGVITNCFFRTGSIYIELDGETKYYTEHFTVGRIKTICYSDITPNCYYIVFKDNSYFKITVA